MKLNKKIMISIAVIGIAAISVIFLFCCVSCGKKRQNTSKIANESIEVLHCQNCSDNSFDSEVPLPIYDDIKFVKLETNDSCLLTIIKQIEIKDFLIFIRDFKEGIFVFNTEGKFIAKIGKRGNGAGEYIGLNTFYIENNNVVIIDEVKNSLIRYDFKGKHLSTEKFPNEYSFRMSWQAIPTDDDKLLLYHVINFEENMAYSLINLKNNELIGKYFSYNPLKVNFLYPYSEHPMTKTPEGVNFILPLCDTIYRYENSSFFPRYVVEIPGKMLLRTQVRENTTLSNNPDIMALTQEGFFTGFYGFFETESHIFLDIKDGGAILGYFLYDKKSKQGNYYLYKPPSKTMDFIPFFRIMASFDDTFVGVFDPNMLLFPDNWEIAGETGVQLKKLLSSLLEDDNPVLCFYKLKK
jgi:hypothetical protein